MNGEIAIQKLSVSGWDYMPMFHHEEQPMLAATPLFISEFERCCQWREMAADLAERFHRCAGIGKAAGLGGGIHLKPP